MLILFSQDGTNSLLTNYYKIALLPQHIYSEAIDICTLYEEGKLIPPSAAKQRQRKSISSSSFQFLKGLNPQDPGDQQSIQDALSKWKETKERPVIPKKVYIKWTDCMVYIHAYTVWYTSWLFW